jgi:DNA-binding transcriptional MerR regulator
MQWEMFKNHTYYTENPLLRIGNFSTISSVSIKTLRYYDEINLFKPFQVDDITGYRYYSLEQLPRLNRILALKDLGLSLEQIARLIDDNPPARFIRDILDARRCEIKEQLEKEKNCLEQVEARLNYIEREGAMPHYDIVLKSLDPVIGISVKENISHHDGQLPLWKDLATIMSSRKTKAFSPSMALFHQKYQPYQTVEVEVFTPSNVKIETGNNVKPRLLSGEPSVATVVHRGEYTIIAQAYALLDSWIEINGYQQCGVAREVYLRGPYDRGLIPVVYGEFRAADHKEFVTEIQLPVAKIS